ncbi:hypothetical protein F5883DRAFT_566158 [Diaporthe sp. PMI_573]|nr:hypothetical protein F5883DRAFT_566158 [Diaporthaceae sp. PMI_573]
MRESHRCCAACREAGSMSLVVAAFLLSSTLHGRYPPVFSPLWQPKPCKANTVCTRDTHKHARIQIYKHTWMTLVVPWAYGAISPW